MAVPSLVLFMHDHADHGQDQAEDDLRLYRQKAEQLDGRHLEHGREVQRPGAPDQLGAILQDIGNCDRGQHNIDRHDLFIEQAADDAIFQQHAEGKCAEHCQQQRKPVRQTENGIKRQAEECAERQHVALNEAHQAGGLVDEAVNAAEHDAGDTKCQKFQHGYPPSLGGRS